jgi:hypothetical protein
MSKAIKTIIDKLSNVTPENTFKLLVLYGFLMITVPYLYKLADSWMVTPEESALFQSEQRMIELNTQILDAIVNQSMIIEKQKLDNFSKNGAETIYQIVFNGTKRDMQREISQIIKNNNIDNIYRQQSIRDLMNHRMEYYYTQNYERLMLYKYNDVKLSDALDLIPPEPLTEQILARLFKDPKEDHDILNQDLDNIVNNAYDTYTSICKRELN